MPKGITKFQLSLLVIILLAWALRLHNLTYHSLWFDEAISVYWTKQTTPRILEVGFSLVEDRLPPLYYLMLKSWTSLVGFSETGIRSLSVLFGVLLVPITADIAGLLLHRRIVLVVALLTALNPFLIWYSQEARMYAPAVFFATLAVWAFLRWLRIDLTPTPSAPQPLPTNSYILRLTFYLLFLLSAIAALYCHLYAGFLLPALWLWFIISYPRAWRLWFPFTLGGLISILAYIPIIIAIWRFSGESIPGDPFSGLGERAWWLLQAFTFWKAPLPPLLQTTIPVVTLVFLFFAYLNPKHNYCSSPTSYYALRFTLYFLHPTHYVSHFKRPFLLLTLLLLIPFLIANCLLFRNHLAFFGERYFIVMVPWFLLLAAAGFVSMNNYQLSITNYLSRILHHTPIIMDYALRFTFYVLRFIPSLTLFLLTILPIPGQWSVPASKEAWRQSVAYLARYADSSHAILIHPDWVRYPFQYYFQGPGQTYAAFSNVTPDTVLDGPMQAIIGHHPVIWLIQSHLDGPDPNRLVEQWLASRYPLITELYPPGVALKGYALHYQFEALPPSATPVDFKFANGLRLAGFQADHTASAADELFHPPSGWLHVTLYWQADRQITTETTPYVHLVGPEGIWGVNLDRPSDALKFYPPSQWPVSGPLIRHDLDINLNPVIPPGRYQLVVGLNNQMAQYTLGQVEIHE
jgi:uncharacterized membrane protein